MTLMILKKVHKFSTEIYTILCTFGIRMEKISLAPLYKIVCMFAHMGNIKSLNTFY